MMNFLRVVVCGAVVGDGSVTATVVDAVPVWSRLLGAVGAVARALAARSLSLHPARAVIAATVSIAAVRVREWSERLRLS